MNTVAARALAAIARRKELNKCKRDLFYLAIQLGYKWNPEAQQGITPHFHQADCDRMDRLHDHKYVATFAQRGGLKSTVYSIVWSIQQFLINPDITIMVNHAVEAEANKIVIEVGGLLQTNEYLRSLEPIGVYPKGHRKENHSYNICPSKLSKKYISTSPSAHFSITTRPKMNPTTRRQYSMMAKGAGSEATGVHVDIIILDDIIGLVTLEESTGMAKIRRWYQVTIASVLNPNGRIRLVGTRYDEHDFYGTNVIGNPDWDVLIRHALEDKDGNMDWSGKPTHWGPALTKSGKLSHSMGYRLAIKREKAALRQMRENDYASQRMNDPTPKGAIPWTTSAERTCGMSRRQDGFPGVANLAGTIFILSDPAPRATSQQNSKELERGDGSKDYWSIAAIMRAIHEQLELIILLDGIHSQNWNRTEGLRQAAILMKKWTTPYFFNENYTGGQGDYTEDMRVVCNQMGVPLFTENGLLPKYNNSYSAGAKNNRFASLASKNDVGEFLICDETCPKEFIYGDERLTGFLTQIRKLRPLPQNRNNLRWDDDADVVARGTDSKLRHLAPVVRSTSRMDEIREREELNQLIAQGRSRVNYIYIP